MKLHEVLLWFSVSSPWLFDADSCLSASWGGGEAFNTVLRHTAWQAASISSWTDVSLAKHTHTQPCGKKRSQLFYTQITLNLCIPHNVVKEKKSGDTKTEVATICISICSTEVEHTPRLMPMRKGLWLFFKAIFRSWGLHGEKRYHFYQHSWHWQWF